MTNWMKRHKFWSGIIIAMFLSVVLGVFGLDISYQVGFLCGLASFIWFLFHLKQISAWLWSHLSLKKSKEATK